MSGKKNPENKGAFTTETPLKIERKLSKDQAPSMVGPSTVDKKVEQNSEFPVNLIIKD